MRLFTEFEVMIVSEMIKLGLDPYSKEDVEKFWNYKLLTEEDALNAG